MIGRRRDAWRFDDLDRRRRTDDDGWAGIDLDDLRARGSRKSAHCNCEQTS
jgi:hypothetical protein